MTEQITIAGHAFNVPARYEEGHELTAGEASALNQTYHENLRNNFAKKVKDAGATADLTALQAELDAYAEAYAFGVRAAGAGTGATRDPVMSEALRLAKKQIGELIKAKGGKVSQYPADQITAAAKKLLDKDPAILDLARQRVAEQQAMASQALPDDLLSDLVAKPTPEPAAPAPAAEQAA